MSVFIWIHRKFYIIFISQKFPCKIESWLGFADQVIYVWFMCDFVWFLWCVICDVWNLQNHRWWNPLWFVFVLLGIVEINNTKVNSYTIPRNWIHIDLTWFKFLKYCENQVDTTWISVNQIARIRVESCWFTLNLTESNWIILG